MKKPINSKDVFRQLRADLIGKDSYRGVTLTYSWLANQFGHIALGYIPSLILYSILKRHISLPKASFWSALIISLTWLLFEAYNFLGPLLLDKHSKSNFLYISSNKKYDFQPAWGNVAFDTITDLCFFWFGAFSASLFLYFSWNIVYILFGLAMLLIYPSSYWFLTKMYLQYAQYPFQFRLSQWDSDISNEDKIIITKFLKNKTKGKHLFVFGGRRSGKTSLCVGIGTEKSIKRSTCIYTTGMKLYSMFFETENKLLLDDDALWTWRTSSLMIIDDINPGNPIPKDLVTPQVFLNMLDEYNTPNEENRRIFKEKSIIWVLGNVDKVNNDIMTWKQMLYAIGIDPVDISSVSLLDSYLP